MMTIIPKEINRTQGILRDQPLIDGANCRLPQLAREPGLCKVRVLRVHVKVMRWVHVGVSSSRGGETL
jgi:hypothetical protein